MLYFIDMFFLICYSKLEVIVLIKLFVMAKNCLDIF